MTIKWRDLDHSNINPKALDRCNKELDAGFDECACEKCTVLVSRIEYTYPYCSLCYLNLDGKCNAEVKR